MRVAILLAAGASRRFGAPNKLFARIGGETLLARAIRIARATPARRLIVVTGAQNLRVSAEVRRADRRAIILHAAGYREGLGASLRAASGALRPIDREALVFLADMPWLAEDQARHLLRRAAQGDDIVRPAYRGRPGHPVLLRGAALASLETARGDQGPGRALGLRARMVPADRRCVADVDRPGALTRRVPRLR
ncbi:nucleotidyltransferase family protein [Sphingomonas sp. PR090111-T3T-6A]|uniref:nucleotidyltransferase family protein n=1 Tax=Sphingomonas sp. PR090111-T3T-6A TaxID=685778 RepID=UPI0003752473|nr:nucleotidyltransferase family protein [Sphingomonas sp. PR090111-T3T-6A]